MGRGRKPTHPSILKLHQSGRADRPDVVIPKCSEPVMPEAFTGQPEQAIWDRVTQFMREAGTLQQSLVLPLSRYCELSVLWDKVSCLEGPEKTKGYTLLARPIAKLEDVLGLHPVGMKTLAGRRGEVKENPLDKFRKQMG